MSPRLLWLLRADKLFGKDDSDGCAAATIHHGSRVGYGHGNAQWVPRVG